MKQVLPMGLYPVVGLKIYPNGYGQVIRKYVGKSVPIRGTRKKITQMTERSKKRMVWKMYQTDVNWRTMTLLSYPERWQPDGKAIKNHLGRMLGYWRYVATDYPPIVSRETLYYCWFMEFQQRGAPHFHVITNFDIDVLHNSDFRKNSARKWADIVMGDRLPEQADMSTAELYWDNWTKVFKFHSHPKNWQELRSKQGAIRYAAKYASKASQKDVPSDYANVGRFWGISRNCPTKPNETVTMDEQDLRKLLDGLGHPAVDWEILPKHLYNLDKNGQLW